MGILVGDSAEEQSTSQGLPPKINSVKIRALVLLEKELSGVSAILVLKLS
jgi:hypothetical protein